MTLHDPRLAAQLRERFPHGLTGILAVGGTRTYYILEKRRGLENPGRLDNLSGYGEELLRKTRELIATFLDFGVQHLIVPQLSFQTFENSRGTAYAAATAELALELIGNEFVRFYQDNDIDPYFAGIDTLLKYPEREMSYRVGSAYLQFQENWAYGVGRHKLIWEVAPIPLYSIWRAHEFLGEAAHVQLEAALDSAPSLQAVHDTLYQYYARAVYGTEVPIPDFYLGSNRNGDVKLRAMLPIALLCGSATRFYYTPYPTMFITRETIQTILNDLAFGKALRSSSMDYKDQLTPEFVEQEYQRVLKLSQDPTTTLGLIRQSDQLEDT
jgi:hypothetical protein